MYARASVRSPSRADRPREKGRRGGVGEYLSLSFPCPCRLNSALLLTELCSTFTAHVVTASIRRDGARNAELQHKESLRMIPFLG